MNISDISMPADDDITTIRVSKSTRDKLDGLGKRGESMDAIINRMIDAATQAKEWATGNED